VTADIGGSGEGEEGCGYRSRSAAAPAAEKASQSGRQDSPQRHREHRAERKTEMRREFNSLSVLSSFLCSVVSVSLW
jgi:hypothetical protein